MFDEAKAQRVQRFIELLKHTTGDFYGQPFTLIPWQQSVVSEAYGTLTPRGVRQYRYVYLEIPKKNGKTELVAGLALYHMFADGEKNGQVRGCASDKEQASLAFDVAEDMINQQPALKKRTKLNLSTKIMTDKISGTDFRVLSSEAYTKHGLNLSACIFDELHAQPNRDLWDVMTKGAGDARRQPIWWVITTAGDDPDRKSIGWEVHEKAVAIQHARDRGDTEHDIPTWLPVIYGYQGKDIYNEANWAKANPSMGITFDVEKLREAAAEAKQNKADERIFCWLRLNQWVTTKLTSWLPLDLWDETVGSWSRTDMLGEDCYLGGDFSTTTDLSSACLIFPPQKNHADWRICWDHWIPEENMRDRIRQDHVPYDEWVAGAWITATPGNMIDYTKIREHILKLHRDQYVIKEMPADHSFASMLMQELEQAGMTCVAIKQTYETLTDPMQLIEVLLKQRLVGPAPGQEDKKKPRMIKVPALTHEPDPVARWAFGNTSISKNGNGQIKYVKEHRGKSVDRTKRIDPIAAWVCGMARAKFYEGQRSVYEKKNLFTV